VLDALVDQTFEEFFSGVTTAETLHLNDVDFVLSRLELILNLPIEVRRVMRSAFFATSDSHPSMVRLQTRFHQLMEVSWTVPLIASGLTRGAATAGTRVILGAALELSELRDQGIISIDEVLLDLAVVTSAFTSDPRRAKIRERSHGAPPTTLSDWTHDDPTIGDSPRPDHRIDSSPQSR